MESLAPECTELKKRYENCFYTWYSEKFLKGETKDDCQDLFQEYRACIEKTLKAKKIDVMIEEHNRASANANHMSNANIETTDK